MSQSLPRVLRGVPGVLCASVLAFAQPAHASQCVVQPTFTPNFEPELEWAWTGSATMPNHKQVMMTPAVADVNGDGVPDVIFNSFAGSNYNTDGVLRAISGDDGHDLWAATDPADRIRGASSVAVGDIDNDGLVEICTVAQSGPGFICFEHDGTFKFRTTTGANSWGGVSFADLQGDGSVEIINGNQAFSATGALLWTGIDGTGGHSGTGPVAFAADIDQDGMLEVVNGRAVYAHDGTLKWRNTSIGHGLAGVGNFDADPYGEVVVVWSGRVSLLDHDGQLLWTAVIPGGGTGGAPNIADFDNDGQPEIGVAGATRYVVFETDGTVKWSSVVQDFSSNRTGSSTFDFEGDGQAEAVYADERFLRIYDGGTGAIRFQVENPSGTTYENPVIADVDADGNAEIIVISNNYAFAGSNGVRVFRDANDGWVNTRRIWNQHAYSVTNVNEDGTIPATPATNWLTPGLNTFRSNSQGTGTTSAFAAPNLQIAALQSSCIDGTTTGVITATVTNVGDGGASAGVNVAFYFGSASPTNLIEVASLTSVLGVGQSVNIAIALAPAPGGTQTIVVVADDDGTGTGSETECIETDNALSADLALSCSPNEPPVAVCQDLTLSAGPQCTASASIDAGSFDPDGDALMSQQTPEVFGLGTTTATLSVSDGQESASCQAQVTVIDDAAPAIQCTAALQVAAGAACSADVTGLLGVVIEDNCSAPTALTYTLDPPSGVLSGVGVHTVQAQVADEAGNVATCQTQVSLVDATPPTVTPVAAMPLLWPPNHVYHTISAADCFAAAADVCAPDADILATGVVVQAWSDEVEDAAEAKGKPNGDGATTDDILLACGTGAVQLRAERLGGSNGRVYTLVWAFTDPSGNVATATCQVGVPHDQGGQSVPVDSGAAYGESCN